VQRATAQSKQELIIVTRSPRKDKKQTASLLPFIIHHFLECFSSKPMSPIPKFPGFSRGRSDEFLWADSIVSAIEDQNYDVNLFCGSSVTGNSSRI
jgi:hypothetical protein